MSKAIIIRGKDEEYIYMRSFAARLAGVSEEFLVRCEQEGLIPLSSQAAAASGIDRKSVRRLSLIKRLHRDLDLDLETIDLVLHMRRQIIDLQDQLAELERAAHRKERHLLSELQQLRKTLTQEGEISSGD